MSGTASGIFRCGVSTCNATFESALIKSGYQIEIEYVPEGWLVEMGRMAATTQVRCRSHCEWVPGTVTHTLAGLPKRTDGHWELVNG